MSGDCLVVGWGLFGECVWEECVGTAWEDVLGIVRRLFVECFGGGVFCFFVLVTLWRGEGGAPGGGSGNREALADAWTRALAGNNASGSVSS